MKQLNVFYRALLDYRRHTLKDRLCVTQRSAIAREDTEFDRIVLTRKICIINEDWVNAIEEGLSFIDKAIKEDRQFIRSNGEVVPIEKVKHVSKDSVEHLAKHSNLITRKTEGEDLIPDQLYTVEKLNDYAVYENRFLYMLLCYLRDFITLRYNNILELSNTYHGTMTMKKSVKMARQQIDYSVELTDLRRDDPYLREHNDAKELIDRINLLLKAVLALLATPLMQVVSKAPMLKPPITKTNVLKMNNNFKQAMALYSFVTSYPGDGYTVETQVKELHPFRDDVADEMAETVLLTSFLVYEHSLGIEGFLKNAYDKEEQIRKEEEYQKFVERLEAIRQRLQKSEVSPEEYILMLESNVRQLEKRSENLLRTRQELEETQARLEDANEQIRALNRTLEEAYRHLEEEKKRAEEELAALKVAYEASMEELRETHDEEIRALGDAHTEEIRVLNEAHAEEIGALNLQHEDAMASQRETHEQELAEVRREHDEVIRGLEEKQAAEIERITSEAETARTQLLSEYASYREEVAARRQELQQKIDEERLRNEELLGQYRALEDQNALLRAKCEALRRESGKPSEADYSTREAFSELEHMYELFTALYKDEWKNTKKRIRKDLLKPEKMAQKAEQEMQKAERKQQQKASKKEEKNEGK